MIEREPRSREQEGGARAPATADDQLDLVFQALANRTRRAMLKALAAGPTKVTELAAPFDMALPSVSKHLSILERAGLVARTVTGRVHLCALEAEPMASAEEWLSAYSRFWNEKLDRFTEFVETNAPDDRD